MTYTLYVVIEDEDGTHLREWGLNNYDSMMDAEEDAALVTAGWYNMTGVDAWEIEGDS